MNNTIKFKLPKSQMEVVMIAELNGGDEMDLQAAGLDGDDSTVSGQNLKVNAGKMYLRRLRKLIEIAIVSISGNDDKTFCWNAVRNLKKSDYNYLITRVNIMAADNTEEEKKIDGDLPGDVQQEAGETQSES